MIKNLLFKTTLLLFLFILGGASFSWAKTEYSLTISTSDFNGTSYAANNNEKTTNAISTSDGTKTYPVRWTSYQVQLQSGSMQWKKNEGSIYNSTDLGTIKSVAITSTEGTFTTYYGTAEQPSSSEEVGDGYFQIKVESATGKSTQVVIVFEASDDPIIDAENINIEYTESEGSIHYRVINEAEVGEISAVVTSGSDWVAIGSPENGVLDFLADENTGTSRSATITFTYEYFDTNVELQDVVKVITITQAATIYAALPFSFDGGRDALASTLGLTQSGLTTDYKNSPLLAFDGTGDYVILQFNQTPGILSFDIKGNSFSGGTFDVQYSADGSSYTDLKSYTTLGGSKATETITNIPASTRYIKWIYTTKDKGNVALGNINLTGCKSATIGSTGWTTFCSTSPLYLGNISASEGTVSAYYASAASSSEVTMTGISTAIAAGQGIMLQGTANATITIPVAASGSTISGNLLVGCTEATDLSSNASYYVLVNDGTDQPVFRSLASRGATIPAGKAYLDATSLSSAPSNLRIVLEENTATTLDNIGASEEAVKFIQNGQLYILRDGITYDVMGHQVK